MYFIIIILQFHNSKHRKVFKTFPATGVLTLSPPFRLYYSSLSQVFSDLVYSIPSQRFSVRATTVQAEYSSSAVADRSTCGWEAEDRGPAAAGKREAERERGRERDKALVINQWGPATATNKMAATSSLRSLRSPDNIRSRCPDSTAPDYTGLSAGFWRAASRVSDNTSCRLENCRTTLRWRGLEGPGCSIKLRRRRNTLFYCTHFQLQQSRSSFCCE